MPTYIFHDTKSDEYWEELCSISAMTEFLKENPHVKQVPQAPSIVAGVSIKGRTDGAFSEVMSKVADANPYSPHADKYGSKDSKSVKRRQLVDKHLRKKKEIKW